MRDLDTLPHQQAMKAPYKARKFRRNNAEHVGRTVTYSKPWKRHNPEKAA